MLILVVLRHSSAHEVHSASLFAFFLLSLVTAPSLVLFLLSLLKLLSNNVHILLMLVVLDVVDSDLPFEQIDAIKIVDGQGTTPRISVAQEAEALGSTSFRISMKLDSFDDTIPVRRKASKSG